MMLMWEGKLTGLDEIVGAKIESRYRGVSYYSGKKRWVAQKKGRWLGEFKTEQEAIDRVPQTVGSRHKGVFYDNVKNAWIATTYGRCLGEFKTEREAADCVQQALQTVESSHTE